MHDVCPFVHVLLRVGDNVLISMLLWHWVWLQVAHETRVFKRILVLRVANGFSRGQTKEVGADDEGYNRSHVERIEPSHILISLALPISLASRSLATPLATGNYISSLSICSLIVIQIVISKH